MSQLRWRDAEVQLGEGAMEYISPGAEVQVRLNEIF